MHSIKVVYFEPGSTAKTTGRLMVRDVDHLKDELRKNGVEQVSLREWTTQPGSWGRSQSERAMEDLGEEQFDWLLRPSPGCWHYLVVDRSVF